jgi:hypothetical protein
LQRAKELTKKGSDLSATGSLQYFLNANFETNKFDLNELKLFSKLDDSDIVSSIKFWCDNEDFVLSFLCNSIINRKLPKVEMQIQEFSAKYFDKLKNKVIQEYKINEEEAHYLIFSGRVSNQAYDAQKDPINILYKNGEIIDIAEASDNFNIQALSETVSKHFICYPKNL